jgi:hypothetical protein
MQESVRIQAFNTRHTDVRDGVFNWRFLDYQAVEAC